MRLVRIRQRSATERQRADVSVLGPGKRHGFGAAPTSIWELPEEIVGLIYARWQGPSGDQPQAVYPRDVGRRQASVEFTTTVFRAAGTTVSFVTTLLLAHWLLRSRAALGGQWLPVTAAGSLAAMGALAMCVRLRPGRRWPARMMVADVLATIASGSVFVFAELNRATPTLQPLRDRFLLGALAFATTGLAALAIWLFPLPVFPFLIRLGRRHYVSHRYSAMTRRNLEGFEARMREILAERPGEWRSGMLGTSSGRLVWVDGGGEVTDLSSALTIDDPKLLPPWARLATYRNAPTVRLQTQRGLCELEIAPDRYEEFQRVTLSWGGSRRQW